MPVTNPVLQDAIEERRPFLLRVARVFPRQLDHRILHEIQRLVAIAHRDFCESQGPPFHARQELVELPFALQRSRLSRLLAAARYRKRPGTGVHLRPLFATAFCLLIANSS